VCSIPLPTTRNQIQDFLGVTGFCWIWILNFAVIAKSPYEATNGENGTCWNGEDYRRKPSISQTGSLSISGAETFKLNKPFFLYVHKRDGTAVGCSSIARVMILASGLFVWTIRLCCQGMASLHVSTSSNGIVSGWVKQVNSWTKPDSASSSCSANSHGI
jgi:hypothetical protein